MKDVKSGDTVSLKTLEKCRAHLILVVEEEVDKRVDPYSAPVYCTAQMIIINPFSGQQKSKGTVEQSWHRE